MQKVDAHQNVRFLLDGEGPVTKEHHEVRKGIRHSPDGLGSLFSALPADHYRSRAICEEDNDAS